MAAEDKYRARALELLTEAEIASSAATRSKLNNLAAAFIRLAIQAERNADMVIEFESPPDQNDSKRSSA